MDQVDRVLKLFQRVDAEEATVDYNSHLYHSTCHFCWMRKRSKYWPIRGDLQYTPTVLQPESYVVRVVGDYLEEAIQQELQHAYFAACLSELGAPARAGVCVVSKVGCGVVGCCSGFGSRVIVIAMSSAIVIAMFSAIVIAMSSAIVIAMSSAIVIAMFSTVVIATFNVIVIVMFNATRRTMINTLPNTLIATHNTLIITTLHTRLLTTTRQKRMGVDPHHLKHHGKHHVILQQRRLSTTIHHTIRTYCCNKRKPQRLHNASRQRVCVIVSGHNTTRSCTLLQF